MDSDSRSIVRKLLILLPISVAINIAIAFIFTDSKDLLRLQTFSMLFFLLAAGLRLVPWITKTLRLLNWMRFLGHRFTFRDSFRVTIMTELGTAISPTSIGGEPVKAGALYQKGTSLGEAASLTTIAAVENLFFYAIGIPAALFIASPWHMPRLRNLFTRALSDAPTMILIISTVAAVLLATVIVIKKTRVLKGIREKIDTFWKDFKALYISMIKRGKGRFIINVFLSAVHWSARYSVVAVLALGLGHEVDFVRFFLLQWVVFTLMSLVPTPGAIGGAEGLFLLLFGGVLSQQTIGTLMIGWRFLDFYFLAILALLILGADTLFERISKQTRTSTLSGRFKNDIRNNLSNVNLEAMKKSNSIGTEKGSIGK